MSLVVIHTGGNELFSSDQDTNISSCELHNLVFTIVMKLKFWGEMVHILSSLYPKFEPYIYRKNEVTTLTILKDY